MTFGMDALDFVLPDELSATGPPEARGLARDEVRLLVANGTTLTHARFHELPSFLRPGDLVVVNNSAALAAAVDAKYGGERAVLHFSTWLEDGGWVVELRDPRGIPWNGPTVKPGAHVHLPGRYLAVLRGPWLPGSDRLWVADVTAGGARVQRDPAAIPLGRAAEVRHGVAVEPYCEVVRADGGPGPAARAERNAAGPHGHPATALDAAARPGQGGFFEPSEHGRRGGSGRQPEGSPDLAVEAGSGADVRELLTRHGRPITYSYLSERWSASFYRTVFGVRPGSAEMPSAGRPFTEALVTELVAGGVGLAPITLHTGVSSPETGEPPSPERFEVPEMTARLVNATRAAGGRVVAVGTTVTRALESACGADGLVRPAGGWTELVLSGERPARAVDGLITGWHAPGASHLHLLESVAGAGVVREAYRAALDSGYLWHEFGDSALLFRE